MPDRGKSRVPTEEDHGTLDQDIRRRLRLRARRRGRPCAGLGAPQLGHGTRPHQLVRASGESSATVPAAPKGARIGGVSKTLTNEYWRSLGEGYQAYAKKAGVEVVYQAAQSEGDQLGQLSIAENLISQGFNALLFSPQTDSNLQPALELAEAQGIPVINVNDAVIPSVRHYVGNVQRDNGVRVAKWFLKNRPQGGKVAVIEGQAGVFAAGQRTKGFSETIKEGGKFTVVASVPGNWDRQIAYDAASTILQQNPDLVGFYANNDGMALGVVEAVKAAGLQDKVVVFGTDGISDAYASIRAGELTGTVELLPRADRRGRDGGRVAPRWASRTCPVSSRRRRP